MVKTYGWQQSTIPRIKGIVVSFYMISDNRMNHCANIQWGVSVTWYSVGRSRWALTISQHLHEKGSLKRVNAINRAMVAYNLTWHRLPTCGPHSWEGNGAGSLGVGWIEFLLGSEKAGSAGCLGDAVSRQYRAAYAPFRGAKQRWVSLCALCGEARDRCSDLTVDSSGNRFALFNEANWASLLINKREDASKAPDCIDLEGWIIDGGS